MCQPKGPLLLNLLKFTYHYFGDQTKFSIGRSTDSSLDIASKFISRNQCLIKLNNEKQWVIKDKSSFQSTRVNNEDLKSGPRILNNGDKITFTNHKDDEFQFYTDINFIPNVKKKKFNLPLDEFNDIIKANNDLRLELSELKESNARLLEERDTLSEENNVLKDKCQQLNVILEEMQKTVEKVESEKSALALKLLEKETTNEMIIQQLQDTTEILKECELELERILAEKVQLQGFNVERSPERFNSQNDVSGMCMLKESPQLFDINSLFDAIEYNSMKEEMDKIKIDLQTKEGRLNEVLAEKDILSTNIIDLLEQEFTCTVCSELLFQATSLECRHTFCAKCVATWKTKKKDCPVCRTKIKSEVMPLIIDEFIDKITQSVGGEVKRRREEIRNERLTKNRDPGAAASPYRFAPYGRRGNRRTRGGQRASRRNSNRADNHLENNIVHLLGLNEAYGTIIDLTRNSLNRR